MHAMKRPEIAPVLIAALALAACGGSGGPSALEEFDASAPATTRPTTAKPAQSAATKPSGGSDVKAIEKVARRYTEGFNSGDWGAACQALSPDSRLTVRAAGATIGLPSSAKCADVLENTSETMRKRRTPDLSELRVRGDTATATNAFAPRTADEETTVRFERIDGTWYLRTNTPK